MKIDQLIDEILTIMEDADQEQLLALGDELQDIGQLFHSLAEIAAVTTQIKQMEQ
jgi:hypothetical protein